MVLSKLRPVLDAVYALAKQPGGIEQLLNQSLEKFGVELEIDDIPDFAVNLVTYVSQAATANGLPPCQYYGNGHRAVKMRLIRRTANDRL